MSLVSIQQLRIFSWKEFLESDHRTERVDSRGRVLSFCVHTRQQHNVVTVPSQSELHSWWYLFLFYQHIDIARRPQVISVANTFAITMCAAHVLSHFYRRRGWW